MIVNINAVMPTFTPYKAKKIAPLRQGSKLYAATLKPGFHMVVNMS